LKGADLHIFLIFLSSVSGYFSGCFSGSYLLGKAVKKIDISRHGTKNPGASNVLMVLGWKWGILTLIIDFSKAFFPVLFFKLAFPQYPELSYIAGFAAVTGHIFPVFWKFKGGKGAASLLGMIFALNWLLGLIYLPVCLAIVFITDYMAAGSVVMAVTFPIATLFWNLSQVSVVFCFLAGTLVLLRHHKNIIKMFKKEEVSVKGFLKKGSGKYE